MVGAYKDSAVSGASMILRPSIQALLDDARRGMFKIVIAEALDRVSRGQADVATLYKHLKFAGVMIVTLSKAIMNDLRARELQQRPDVVVICGPKGGDISGARFANVGQILPAPS